jgi:hypothetical protein
VQAGQALPGLHTAPDSAGWVVARLAWLPVFAVALAACWAAFRGHERPRRTSRPDAPPARGSRTDTPPPRGSRTHAPPRPDHLIS